MLYVKQLRFGTDVYKAREALEIERKPLYIKELIEKIGEQPTRNRRSSLSSQLSAYANKGEIFVKTAPNTFGLIDYGPEPVTAEEIEAYDAEIAEAEIQHVACEKSIRLLFLKTICNLVHFKSY